MFITIVLQQRHSSLGITSKDAEPLAVNGVSVVEPGDSQKVVSIYFTYTVTHA